MNKNSAPTLKDIYPHLDETQLLEVEDTLDRYLAFVLGIFDQMELEKGLHEGSLTPDVHTLGYDK